MIASIHQPNFFPYAGFFQKMDQCDVFVIMMHCQYERQNYQNRFNYQGKWLTMSVNRGLEPIRDKYYIKPQEDWDRIKRIVNEPILDEFDDCITESLVKTNVSIIRRIAAMLDIETRIVYDYDTELSGTPRLVDICNTYSATGYLSGISGKRYLDFDKFEGIKLQYQENIDTRPIIDLIK